MHIFIIILNCFTEEVNYNARQFKCSVQHEAYAGLSKRYWPRFCFITVQQKDPYLVVKMLIQ